MQLFGFDSPQLFKFCSSKYDITKGCDTLRIGTLWGFREEENELLRDEGEGKFAFKIRFPVLTPVSNEWVSEIETDAGGSAHIEEMSISNGKISIKGATLEGSAHNCWIFCVSTSAGDAGSVSYAHESRWSINGDRVQEFGNFLARLIWNNISIDDFPTNLIKRYKYQEIVSGLELFVEMRPVEYTDREVNIKNESDFPVEKLRELKARIPFIKPKRFCEEQEFRFAFSLMFRKQKISINDNPKILPLREVDQFVAEN